MPELSVNREVPTPVNLRGFSIPVEIATVLFWVGAWGLIDLLVNLFFPNNLAAQSLVFALLIIVGIAVLIQRNDISLNPC
jgi:hypothetical protein